SYKKFMAYVGPLLQDQGQHYLLLDEIQRLDSFEFVLNGYLSKGNTDIYVTGSNSRFLSSQVITEFRGRGDEIHLLSLSFSEFYAYRKGDIRDALQEYMVYGGLPQVVLASDDKGKIDYLNSQMEKTFLKDVLDKHQINNVRELGELLTIIASGISSLTNPAKLARAFKSKRSSSSLSEDTISDYISYFEESFLLSKSLRYDVKGKSYINTPYKLYFEDVGLRNARLGFRQVEYNHIMENIIYNELRYRGYSPDVGVVEVRSKKEGKDERKYYEVDFIVNEGSQRIYIQSAYNIEDEEKMNQETKSLDNISDSFKKIVVVKDNIVPHQSEKGYLFIGLTKFLCDQNSLVF
ncbi:MAG: ATP-binding protein, partial [Bacilli bacterium]